MNVSRSMNYPENGCMDVGFLGPNRVMGSTACRSSLLMSQEVKCVLEAERAHEQSEKTCLIIYLDF